MSSREAVKKAKELGVEFTKSKGQWFWMDHGEKVPPGYGKISQAAFAALKALNR